MMGQKIYSSTSWLTVLVWCSLARDVWGQACKFYPLSENRRFERVVENIPVGQEIFRLEVFPRTELTLEAVDNSLSDISHFRYEEVDSKTVAIKIAKSLDDLVDRREPESVLKFKLKCKGEAGTKEDFLPITVYVEDINDHAPEFLNTPYHLAVDELTPVGLTIFRGIHAIDRDKPNTANSDVTYSIVGGNEDNAFVLSDPIEGILVVNKPLDFDKGVREFKLEIQASDHGSPQSLSTITTMTIRVKDADDQNPVFTQETYKTSVTESPIITGAQIRQKLNIDPPIHAYDQDIGINTPVRYKIILGNDHGFFELEEQIGDLYLVKEVDLESLPNPVLNLQIQATQVDNPVRYGIAKVDINVLDVNDNSPIFEFETYNLTVVENLPSDFTVVQVHAEDKDQGDNAKFSYKLIDPSEAFKIDTTAGWIRVRDPSKLDRESKNLLVLKVIAEEQTPSVNSQGVESSAMVQIHLLDANDNNPKFVPSAIYNFKITETDSPGNIIGSVAAVDPDLGLNGIVHYTKQDDSLSRTVPFDIFPMNGSIYLTESFSSIILKPPVYTFFVIATDSAKSIYERRSSVAVIHINVTDTNNITPEFQGAPYEAAVGESLPAGTFVTRVMAKDPDVDTVLTFSIIRGNDEQKFVIDSRNGQVLTADVLDYEQRQSYDLLVQVSDGVNTAATPLSVKVVDINDRQPVFTHNYYNFSVVEEIRQNITIGSVLAIDSDSGKNAAVRYSILGSRASKVFRIDQRGNIFTQRSLDRETETKLEFLVVAFDGGLPQLSGTSTVMVYVEDINDNPPTFESDNYVVNVPEEREPPYKVFEIIAEDKDSGENAEMKYNIIGGNENNAFEIDEDSGIVYTADKLNYEDQSEHKLEIVARNTKPFQGPTAVNLANPVVQLIVRVQDINDGAVVFSQPSYQYGILENTPRAESIGFVNATNFGRSPQDQDITYWIGEGNDNDLFWVNPNTGMVILMDTLDADPPANQRLFNLKIFARDNLSINSFNSSVPVRIEIVDVNDNFPKFNEEHYSLQLPENLQVGTKLPAFYTVEDIDSEENGIIKQYFINGSQETFFVNSTTGDVRLISVLDYETQERLEFMVYAVDGGNPSRTGSATVVVKVQNINEYSPEFVGLPYDFWVEENAVTGTAVGRIQAVDKDRDNVKYDILQGDKEFFGIEKDTGKVYVKKNLTGRSKYGFVAQATDDGLPEVNTLGVQVNIFVRETNDFPPVFSEERYKGYVTEKENTDRVIAKVSATDRDLQNNTVTYKITSGNEDGIFLIESQEGNIRVNKTLAHKLNYDTKKQYILLVQAKDSHNSPQYGLTTVTIDVLDTNDHPPVFTKPAFSIGIPENKPAGHCFLKVEADSGDTVDNVTYSLGTKDVPFTVNQVSGELCTNLVLDREQKEKYEFNVVATDGKFESAVAVTLEVEDENDNPPQFERGRYAISIPQESKAGRSIAQLHARDPDAANNGEVTYWIKNTYGLFEIDPQTGLVRLASGLPDHVQRNTSFEMEVFAQDHGITSSISKTTLTVRVSNVRNHPPDFEQFAYTVAIDENLSNFPLLTVHASDVDSGEAGEIGYRIVRATRPEPFRIDQKSGKISLISPLDREQVKYLELVVEARDEAPEPQFVTTVVQITVNDINDNPPVFLSTPKFLRVPLSTSQREVIYQVEAVDKDSPFNGNNVIKYEILPPNPVFSIHPKTGQIFASQALSLGVHSLNIKASDSGEESLSSFIQLNVEIYKDSIDEPTPVFTSVQYDVTLDDLLQPGDSVLHVRATTPNGAPFSYGVKQVHNEHIKRFSIDPETGLVTAATRLDPQEEDLHHFLVTATSKTNSSHYVEAGVIVRLSGRNTRCPKFPFSEYYATVKENTAPDSAILPNLQVEEAEKFRKLSYLITEDNSEERFYIDYKIASSVSLRVKKRLDRDGMPSILQGVYTLTVTASNQRCASSSTLKVLVEDENDNNPVFEKKNNLVELKENTPSGHVVTKLTATDKDELDEGKLRYIIVEGNNGGEFQIDLETGVLSVAKSPDRETTPVFMLRILAVDTANNTGLANVHIIILDENDWTPTFLNSTFVFNATEGRASLGAGIRLPVKDNDEGKNGQLEVLIEEGNSDKHFRLGVDEEGAIFSIRKELDRESYNVEDNAIHIVKVAARDSGVPPRTGTAQVMVIIRDINDNPPKFEKEVYYQFLSESAPVGIVFETVKATDADSARNTNLSYSFDQTYKNVPFDIDPILGTINVTRQLDISEAQEYSITLEAFDGLWKGTALLKIYVNEAAERDPRFNQLHYRFSVPENTPGALVGRVELQTRQLRANSQTVYSIVNTDSKKFFDITLEGDIFTKQGLDREAKSSHTFTVMLEESRPSTKVSVSEVTVEVLDLNDEVPTFRQSYKGSVKENVPPGTPVLVHPSISAVDNDSGNNSVVHYSLGGSGSELFAISENGAVVFSPQEPHAVLDRERKEKYDLYVTATDLGNLSSSTYLTITVEDENDNAPVFQHGPLFVLLPETSKPGTKVIQVIAHDADAKGINSEIEYYITSGSKNDIRIDRITGELYVVGTLIPDTVYHLNISATDGRRLTSYTPVNINITDVNDHRPKFVKAEYSFSMKEGDYTVEKWKVGTLHAEDEDTGRNGKVDYNIVLAYGEDFPFVVDVHTGELFAKGVVDRETRSTYTFIVMALDYGEPPLNSTVNVKIEVNDVNDVKPKFFTDPYLAQVPENLDPGYKVTQIAAYDPDLGKNGLVFYKLGKGHQNKFYIDSKDGTLWTLSTLDYEKQEFFNMTVIAYDQGVPSLSSTAKLWITVSDTNDIVPEFPKSVYTLEVAESTKPGESIFQINAGTGPFRYYLKNKDEIDTFIIEELSGHIVLTKPLDSVHRSHYKLEVISSDDANPPKSDSTEVNIVVGTGHGVRLFPSRLYEVSVRENGLAPLVILDLNSTDEIAYKPVKYSIATQEVKGLFAVESHSGQLSITSSLDREKKGNYTVKVRVEDTSKRHRRSGEELHILSHHLAFDEALVLVKVLDENDNSPVFENSGRPLVAAVPLEGAFGYKVTQVKATDIDEGYNGEVRYKIVQKEKDASSKFHIDPVTGIIRSTVTFSLDTVRLFKFDIKATDREGSDDGNSALTSVFIYVLPETKLVLFVTENNPIQVEERLDTILKYLSKVTKYEVKMAKLAPHQERDIEHPEATDLYVYGVNHETNKIVETEDLLKAFSDNSQAINAYLDNFKIRRIQEVSVQEKISQMGTTEIAIIALSSVIFLGAVLGIALLCSSCRKRKLRKRQTSWEQQRMYNTKNPLMGKALGNPYGSRTPTVTEAHLNTSYANGDAAIEFPDNITDPNSLKKSNKRSRQQVPPDGASSHTRSKSPRFDRYKVDGQWYDLRDGGDSLGSGFSSWSSRLSHHSKMNNPISEL